MKNTQFIWGFGLLLLASCGSKPQAQKAKEQAFPVITAAPTSVTGYHDFPVTIQGINNNEVRAKISGYIQKVYVDEGQYVQAGQPLFKLETNNISQTANAAHAGVTASNANVAALEASVAAAQLEVDKLLPLVQKNIISDVQLQTARANLRVAESQLGQAKAGLAQARANYEGAVANVDYSIIRAPVSGVVGKIMFRLGSLVGPSDQTPITTVSDTKQLYGYFSMNEGEYLDFLEKTAGANIREKLKNFPSVELVLANGTIFPGKGKIETVTGQVDPSTGSIQFRVKFTNESGLLTNGNTGVVRIPETYNNVIVIPQSAVYEQQGVITAYRVDEKDTARSVVLKLSDRFDNIAIIHSGVNTGDRLVADGVGNLKPGTKIKPQAVSMDSVINSIKPLFD